MSVVIAVTMASAFAFLFVLCFAVVGANTDREEDDELQEQFIREWNEKRKGKRRKQ